MALQEHLDMYKELKLMEKFNLEDIREALRILFGKERDVRLF
jgi:hypothetical protein